MLVTTTMHYYPVSSTCALALSAFNCVRILEMMVRPSLDFWFVIENNVPGAGERERYACRAG
jgi:hypothetical protein